MMVMATMGTTSGYISTSSATFVSAPVHTRSTGRPLSHGTLGVSQGLLHVGPFFGGASFLLQGATTHSGGPAASLACKDEQSRVEAHRIVWWCGSD
jgi:hypothetical protein